MYETFGTPSHLIWLDPSGYYVAALTTLLVGILLSLYFANSLKDDVELGDEGLGADEVNLEDNTNDSVKAKKLNNIDDDDEAYEEDQGELLSESDDAESSTVEDAANDSNLIGKFKAKRYQENLEKNLSPSQIEEELRIEREQLAAIFELLRKQEDELNLKERISDTELEQQLKLYR